MSEHASEARHIPTDGEFILVWLDLLLLTALTVAMSHYLPGRVGLTAAAIITPVKAGLILAYFMHLKYERRGYLVMFLSTLGLNNHFPAGWPVEPRQTRRRAGSWTWSPPPSSTRMPGSRARIRWRWRA